MEFNDIANEKLKALRINDNEDSTNNNSMSLNHATVKHEDRSDTENEALADLLSRKLKTSNLKPLLAVGYSGIPRATIERHLATATELGDTPVKLFIHLIKQEPQWRNYQERKEARKQEVERGKS